MTKRSLQQGWASAAIAILLTGAASVQGAQLTKQAQGMIIHVGVTRAVVAQASADPTMHGGVPAAKGSHHVVVALYDRTGNQRISEAEVTARVGEIGLASVEKKMEPMVIDKTVTWGNYFQMSAPGQYRIEVRIRRPGAAGDASVNFDYLQARR